MPSTVLYVITVAGGLGLIGIILWEIFKIHKAKLRDYRQEFSS